jgi:hypothetical protein
MKTTFSIAAVCGFVGVLAAAHYVPWVAHVRLPSQTTVVANGGRAEQFVIRLPADRIAGGGSKVAGMRAELQPGAMPLPPEVVAQPMLMEHFKVRNSAGTVIGIAARHWSEDSRGIGTAWSVLIPSRGALLLTAPGETGAALDAALKKAGYSAGNAWSGELKLQLAPEGDDGGVVAGGTEEFGGLDGRYSEVWTVTGIGENGELRGTIELNTVTRRGS